MKSRTILSIILMGSLLFAHTCISINTVFADSQLQIENVRVTDTSGNPLTVVQVKQNILIQFDVSNLSSNQQTVAYELKILGTKGTYYDASNTFNVSSSKTISLHELWSPLLAGQYTAEISIVQSLTDHTTLEQPVSVVFFVGDSTIVPPTQPNPPSTQPNPPSTQPNPPSTQPNPPSTQIPDWVKSNTKSWHDNKIGDSLYLQTIKFLINSSIIKVQSSGSSTLVKKVPTWIKSIAGWWTDGQISDSEYVSGIQYLIDKQIILL